MPTALVVDDAQVSRVLAGQILSARNGMNVVYAENGQEAFEMVEREPPDLVVTDMKMPVMDGLQLVSKLHASHPSLPVILMTAHGSEDLAAAALRNGAVSYLPKRNLVHDLAYIVDRVRTATGSVIERPRAEISASLTEYRMTLDSDLERIAPLIAYFRAEIERSGLCDDTGLMQFAVALDEALNNAMCHGNLEVDSALKEDSMSAFMDKVRERRTAEPWRSRNTHVRLELTPDAVVCVIRDEGDGFDRDSLPDPSDPAQLEKASGRGLVLMQTFCDEVRFNDNGNEVTLVKRMSSEDG